MRVTWLLPGQVAASGLVGPGDLPELAALGIRSVLSLTERDPLRDVETAEFRHLHVPVPDMGVPGDDDLGRAVEFLRGEVRAGRPVLAHCFAGYGRTGTVLACFLAAEGATAEEAIRMVRAARPGSIETPEQEECVRAFAARER